MMRKLILTSKRVVKIYPKAPFNFNASLHKPSHFPSSDTFWVEGKRWQTMLWDGNYYGLKFENSGEIDSPEIKLSIYSKDSITQAKLDSLISEINFRYDFNIDLTEFTKLFQKEKLLQEVIKRRRGARISNYVSLYEYLIIGIVLQNATVKRSVQMLQNLYENYGISLEYDGKVLSAFWKPSKLASVSEEELRSLKVGYRAKSFLRVSQAFAESRLDELMLRDKSKEEQRETLLALYGVGPATVGYILFDVFKHYDELRYISPWEQKIYSKLFFNTNPESPVPVNKLLKFFDSKFSKYKMLAVHYIWEDLFWKRRNGNIPWLEKLIRL